MSDQRVEVVGWDAVAQVAARVPDACERAASEAADDAATMLATTTRARVPKRSGRLASSIAPRRLPTGAEVMFGQGVPYAGWVEYGGTRGRPYVADGRYLGAGRDEAERVFVDRTGKNTDDNVRRLPWP